MVDADAEQQHYADELSSLLEAARAGDDARVQALVERGAAVDARAAGTRRLR